MKISNLLLGAGLLFSVSSCESTRQTTNADGTTVVSTTTDGTVTTATTTENAVTVNGNTMANSTINSTTRGTVVVAPATVQTAFVTRYPNAADVKWYEYRTEYVPIDWELTGWPALTANDYTVVYNMDNGQHYAWYDAQGNWIGSTSPITDFAGLPAAVTQMLTSKYAGYTLKSVHAETYKDQSGYELELTQGETEVKMVVDVNGNILKQKTKTVDAAGNKTTEKIKN